MADGLNVATVLLIALTLSVVAKVEERRFCLPPSIYFSRASQLLCLQFDNFGKPVGRIKEIYNAGLYKTTYHYESIPFTLDGNRQQIYWVDLFRKEINRASLNDSVPSKVVDGVVGDIHNLALDEVSGNIYWTDKGNKWIGVSSVRKKFSKIIAHELVDDPRGLVVDPNEGYLFWSDIGVQKKIERCRLDGSYRSVLVNTGIAYPYDLSLDTAKKRLFWMTDGETCNVNYDGKDRSCFSKGSIRNLFYPNAFSYSVSLNTLFYSDTATHNIKSFNLTSNQSKSDVTITYYLGRTFLDQVKVFDATPKIQDPCHQSQNPCSHLCFRSKGGGHSCSCPSGMTLLKDGRNCKALDKDFEILMADGKAGKLFSLTKFVNQSLLYVKAMPNPSNRKSFPIAVAYDADEQVMFWSDWLALRIFRMNINGSNYRPVTFAKLVEGMAFDPVSRLLFWTSHDDYGIHAAKPDGSSKVTITKLIKGRLRDIVLFSEKGLMFYGTWQQNAQVVQMNMDGSNPTILFDMNTKIKVNWLNGIELDRHAEKLYCTDAFYKRIIMYDLKSRRSAVLFNKGSGPRPPNNLAYPRISEKGVSFPFGITISKEHLYWTDWDNKAIYGLNRIEGHWSKTYFNGFAKPQDLQAFQVSKTNDFKYVHIIAFSKRQCTANCSVANLAGISLSPCPSGYRVRKEKIGCYETDHDPDLGVRTVCTDWASCLLRLEHNMPCQRFGDKYISVGLRQCVQVIKFGFCPLVTAKKCPGLQNCHSDQDCLGDQKCCNSSCGKKCAAPSMTRPKVHPCQTSHRQCNICVSMPNNTHRCLCPANQYLAMDGITCETEKDLCSNFTCQNNGACKVTEGVRTCSCPTGFSGKFCEINDACRSNPCLQGGSCIPTSVGYICSCSNYTAGSHCELPRKCTHNICRNNAPCHFKIDGGIKCTCMEEFEGQFCEKRTKCNGEICHNNSTCKGLGLESKCVCLAGFTGSTCGSNIACYSNPCLNKGTCIERSGLFSCNCLPGYSGSRCEYLTPTFNITCQNKGKLVKQGSIFRCHCASGFTGTYCENHLHCFKSLCQNNGTCQEAGSSYKCLCPFAYTGFLCETKLNCAVVNCQNKGICRETKLSYKCLCAEHYTGRHCESKLPCYGITCQNNGICMNNGSIFKCQCPPGFTGTKCETRLYCFSSPCRNKGTCRESKTSFQCVCPSTYTGKLCETSLQCVGIKCRNNGTCQETSSSYKCLCAEHYTGRHCEAMLPCRNILCKNGGNCINEERGFTCKCKPGYYGTYCENVDKIIPCSKITCNNGGNCTTKSDATRCICKPSFTGPFCESRLYCPSLTCLNNGACIERGFKSYCRCAPSYTGYDCSTKIDYCVGNKCTNGAKCINGLEDYTCECRSGYSGSLCNVHKCSPNPCENGGRCQLSKSRICQCTSYFIGEYCLVYIGNSILSTIMKPSQGSQITIVEFKTVLAKLYTRFCKSHGNSVDTPCNRVNQQSKRTRREPMNTTNEFSRDNVHVLTGYPKDTENGAQEFQYTILTASSEGGQTSQTPAPIDFIRSGLVTLRSFAENELKVTVLAVKQHQVENDKISDKEDQENNKWWLWVIIVVGSLAILIFIAVYIWKILRKKSKQHQGTFPNGITNQIYTNMSFTDESVA